MIDELRASDPVDPAEPVLVAGDPEYANLDERTRLGVPLPETLTAALRGLAAAAPADWLLEPSAPPR
jgi:LDH2 family malate/lactate/ureidoglycolate dehydrogenase